MQPVPDQEAYMADEKTKTASTGEPDTPADEAAARRAAQEAREASAAFDPVTGDVNGNGAGESIADRAAAAESAGGEGAETGTEPDGQDFFVVERGKRVTLSTLYNRGTKVTFETQLTGKVLKGPGSLLAFSDPDITLVVPARAGKVEIDPVYDEDGGVKEVHVRQKVKAKTFFDSESDAGREALGAG
jgi:hypothetical protein